MAPAGGNAGVLTFAGTIQGAGITDVAIVSSVILLGGALVGRRRFLSPVAGGRPARLSFGLWSADRDVRSEARAQ